MKECLKFSLPDWLFKPKKSMHCTSSTVAAFSPEEGIKSTDGFKGSMLPRPEAAQLDKMTVLINDSTLRYENADAAIKSATLIQHLIDEGFQIYIIQNGSPRLLRQAHQLPHGDLIDAEKAAVILVKDTKIPRDDIVVCNFEKLEELRLRRFGINAGYEYAKELILDQWDATQTIPIGQGLPPVEIKDEDISKRGWAFQDALAASDINHSISDYMQKQQNAVRRIPNKVMKGHFNKNYDEIENKIKYFHLIKNITIADLTFGNNSTFIPSENKIESLYMVNTKMPYEVFVNAIGKLTYLTSLFVYNFQLTDALPLSDEPPLLGRIEALFIRNQSTIITNTLLKMARNIIHLDIKSTRKTIELDSDLIYGNKHVKQLDLTGFYTTTGSWMKFLTSCDNIEMLNVHDLSITNSPVIDDTLNLRKLKKLSITNLDYQNSLSSCVISRMLASATELEHLDIAKNNDTTSYLFNVDKTVDSFKNLKSLRISNIHFFEGNLQYILESAKKLKLLNLSCTADFTTNTFTSELSKAAENISVFAHIEELDLSGHTLTADELFAIIQKMPKLRILRLYRSTITGYTDRIIQPNPIIHISMNHTNIPLSVASKVIQHTDLIALDISGLTFQNGETLVLPPAPHAIMIDLSGWEEEKISQLSLREESIRSLILNDTVGEALTHFSGGIYPYMTELYLRSRNLNQAEIFGLVSAMPNLREFSIDKDCINPELFAFISQSQLKNKHKIIQSLKQQYKNHIQHAAEYTQEQRERLNKAMDELSKALDELLPSDTVRGNKLPGVVYDSMADFSEVNVPLNPSATKPSYQLSPMFRLKSGPDLMLENARLYCYIPHYTEDAHSVVHKAIRCDLKPYHSTSISYANPSIYEQENHETSFNNPRPDIGLLTPWIRLRSLTANDQLLSLSTSMNPSDYELHFSEPDGFYYIILRSNILCPQHVTLSYQIAARLPSCHELPESIKAKRKPFNKLFDSPPEPDFERKLLKDKLAHIIEHPENHACAVRSDAFLYSIENNPDIQGYRGAGSQLHGWTEIKYKDIWYTVDLGGAPADIEYLPDQAPTQAQAQPLIPAKIVEATEFASAVIPKEDFLTAFENEYHAQSDNTNILVICKRDRNSKHLRSVRQYIKSLSPDRTMAIDNYDNALSSSAFIALHKESSTWEPIEPLGTEGWVPDHIKDDSTLIIDWTSFTANQSTKMNSSIDLNDRNMDGVQLSKKTKVIGLIYEDDPRLKDSSFCSRHSGRIFDFRSAHFQEDTPPHTESEMQIELYNSPHWQKLILGMLGFDEDGTPVFKGKTLLNAHQSMHLSINNPPENCDAFERFIDDLRAGRSFKYGDKNITLPRMKITLTHGYDFTSLQEAVKSLNTDVSAEQLLSIEIDHVLTPSTFERCLETRKIVDGKLRTSPGWLDSASSDRPLSVYITKTLSKQQYCFLLKSAQKQSLRLYCAPGVELPRVLAQIPRHEYMSTPFYRGGDNSVKAESIFDVSELTADDILYRFDYKHDKEYKRFIFNEKISHVWKKLEKGEDVVLTGVFSDELMDHLATLLMPKPYVWHDGQKKYFSGKLILQPKVNLVPTSRPEPKHIKTEADRKPALLDALAQYPIVFIEGKPGIGKSCFIREMKSDKHFNCFSFNPHDNTSLKAWAASKDEKPTILFIDEATELGTDFTMFRGLNNPKREILIDGEIFALSKNHYVVPIGNRKTHMPALLNEAIPTLVFDTLTRDYVINTILEPIFAEVGKETALKEACAHYENTKSVRQMQGEAISRCASKMNQCRGGLTPQAYPPSFEAPTRPTYHLTVNRQPIFDAIINSLHARQFMQQASADSARYGGQTGHMLEGLPGIGKSDIIHAAMLFARYKEITNLNELHEADRDHRFRYYRIPATCNIQNLRKHLRQAFDQGCIVHIDELDALLKPDTRDKEGEVSRLVAELNAYLMGEDAEHHRPSKPGFMLLATGNGITYSGRASLPDSLKSRLRQHAVQPYTEDECQWIIAQKYPELNASSLIKRFIENPEKYTFRELLKDCRGATPVRPCPLPDLSIGRIAQTHTAAPIFYHFYHTRAFKITLPGVLVGVSLGLSLAYKSTVNSTPIIAAISTAGAITAAIIMACATHDQQTPLRSQLASLGA